MHLGAIDVESSKAVTIPWPLWALILLSVAVGIVLLARVNRAVGIAIAVSVVLTLSAGSLIELLVEK